MRDALRRWKSRALPPLAPLDRRLGVALGAILGVAAVLRVAFALQAEEPSELRDPVFYLLLGHQMATGEGYTYPGSEGGPTAYYPPGYPMVLGAVFWVGDLLPGELSRFGAAVALNVVLSVVLVALVFALGRRLAGDRVGLGAAALTAVWPNLVFHSGVVLTETLFLVLFVALLLVALATPEVARHPGRWRLVTVGVLFGLTGLVRPVSFVIAPLFLVLWWRDGVALALRRTAVVGLATVAVLVPWAVRSTVQMDAPVLLSLNFGDNLCIGNNDEATGAFSYPPDCLEGYEDLERPEYETRRQSDNIERSLTWLREHPGEALGLVPDRLRYTLRDDWDGLNAASDYGTAPIVGETTFDVLRWVADVFYFVLLAGAVVGLALGVARGVARDRRWLFLVLTAPAQLLSPLLTFGDPRFKMPVYPVLALCAALLLVRTPRREPAEGPDTSSSVVDERAMTR